MRAMTTRRLVLAAAALVLGAAAGPSTASAGPTVYVAGAGNEFGTLDLVTGNFTSIGTLSLSGGGNLFGMGFGSDGKLYGLDNSLPTSNLYQIDVTNANATLVGGIDQSVVGATADAAGKMYALSGDSDPIFYTLDPPSTTTTVVGPTNIPATGLAAVNASGTQFFAGANNFAGGTELYSIDTTTGAATLLGDMGFLIIAGMFVGDTLYGFDDLTHAIVTIDTTTGAGTRVATYSLPDGHSIYASAVVASQNGAVPEPSTLALAAMGGLGLVGVIRRRRRA